MEQGLSNNIGRNLNLIDIRRFYKASASELQGDIGETAKTPFYPRSSFGVSKLYVYRIIKNYIDYNDSNDILFNHESPICLETFVTRKITIGLNKILKR